MVSFRSLSKRATPVTSALGAFAEAVLFLCLLPAIVILAWIEARRAPRLTQALLEDRQHHA